MSVSIRTLFDKGYHVTFNKGRIEVLNDYNVEPTIEWQRKNYHAIAFRLARELNKSIYSYTHYTTGSYKNGTYPGVTLYFVNLLTGQRVYAIFNAQLKRTRTTRAGKAGSSLPKGMFHVGHHSSLSKLWQKSELAPPRRPSELYKSMGKLKCIYFTANISKESKLANSSIIAFDCSSTEIRNTICGSPVATLGQFSDNEVAVAGGNDKRQSQVAINCGKENTVSEIITGDEGNSIYELHKLSAINTAADMDTRIEKYDLSYQGKTNNVTTIPNNKNKKPEEQTHQEWLEDYGGTIDFQL